jgi:hypothetical protein
LKQNEMIVFNGSIIRGLDQDLSRHAEMNAKRVVAGKFEEHPFSARLRAEKFHADQSLLKLAHITAAKDAVSCVQAKIDNLPAAPGVPLFAKPFDFGQLRHRADYVARECDQRWIGRSAGDAKFGSLWLRRINIEQGTARST